MDYLLVYVQLTIDLLPYTDDPVIGRSDHTDRETLGKGIGQHQLLQPNGKDEFQLLDLYLLELLLYLQVDQLLYKHSRASPKATKSYTTCRKDRSSSRDSFATNISLCIILCRSTISQVICNISHGPIILIQLFGLISRNP